MAAWIVSSQWLLFVAHDAGHKLVWLGRSSTIHDTVDHRRCNSPTMLHMPGLIFSLATCTLFQLCTLVFTDLHTTKKQKRYHAHTHTDWKKNSPAALLCKQTKEKHQYITRFPLLESLPELELPEAQRAKRYSVLSKSCVFPGLSLLHC